MFIILCLIFLHFLGFVGYIDPLRTKPKLFYLKAKFVPRSKHHFGLKNLMLYRAKSLFRGAYRTHKYTLWTECRISEC
jgi:hypothetical protein